MSGPGLSHKGLAAYSALAVPLAMAALPVYVHVPKLYGDALGVPLATVGAILLAARLLDAFQDPLFGHFSDRCVPLPVGRRLPIILGLPFLVTGFIALFHPPQASAAGLSIWLAASLLVAYAGFSLAGVSYLALGADLSADYHQRTRVTALRGAFGLLGILVAASAPGLLADEQSDGLALFSLLFIPVTAVAAYFTLRHSPPPAAIAPSPGKVRLSSLLAPFRNASFRWLVAVFILSGIAGAIPGTLILFYVDDVLQRADLSGLFLGLYFLGGAAGMPLWLALSRRIGKKRAWMCSMLVAIGAFVWAYFLGAGDVAAFCAVCAISGIAYGAELAIPASMLADIVEPSRADEPAPGGAYFGQWQMIEKVSLALAAGIALPMLGALGYEPGQPDGTGWLSATYALLPCVVKLAAIALLAAAPLDDAGNLPDTTPLQGANA